MDKKIEAFKAIKEITELVELVEKIDSGFIKYNKKDHDEVIKNHKEKIKHIVNCL